jgi:MoaA/NifB/PqqE/SkfB family radical SAM enzyme
MSLIYKRKPNQPSLTHVVSDFHGEIAPFVERIDRKLLVVPMVLLKTVEWSIYRWYKTPIRRFYSVRGNELIYMITRRCTDKCPKCGIWKVPESDGEHLPISCFINCMNRLRDNLYQVTLTGGEPLVYVDDLLLIAEEARRHDVPMVTVTNGTLLTESFLLRYAELKHILVISIDTIDRSKWSEFRGRSHYDKVMGNIRLARRYLARISHNK